ncbi:Hpt domain-containing protein [Bacillus sp. Bva_UNVM-123]|uniref:Hpt domain-containing protein n=1 Tax=Bacillus sp. Bva_UNVM-123 TaxID=2829798 RepID=UPI00391F9DE0
MNLNKYKNLLFKKIKVQITDWFESGSPQAILNEDVIRFLHSIKGTAGTLQLSGLQHIASNLLEAVEKDDGRMWTAEELRNFLYDLIELSYEYEHFQQIDEKNVRPREGDIPLIQLIDSNLRKKIRLAFACY